MLSMPDKVENFGAHVIGSKKTPYKTEFRVLIQCVTKIRFTTKLKFTNDNKYELVPNDNENNNVKPLLQT